MGKAVKTVITITVYSGDPFVEADGESEGFPLLNEVIYQMTYGDAVGDYEVSEPETVEGDTLREALVAIGNDGTFFDHEDDDDE